MRLSAATSDPTPGPEKVRWHCLKNPWFAVIASIVLVWITYHGTFRVPLLLDDNVSIVENPSIRELWTLPGAFSPPDGSGVGGRPFSNFSFAISYAISGLDPWGYHLLNLTIHSLAALTLFGIIRRTLLMPTLRARFGDDASLLAGIIAILWAVHPLLTQTVTYISQRTELLMALFYLLTLYCFIRGIVGRSRIWHPLAVGACLLGAMCKETIVTAPLVVLLYDRSFVAGTFRAALRQHWRFYVNLAATWLLLGWMLMGVDKRGVGLGLGITPFQYALTQCKAVVTYLSLSLWPHPLIFEHSLIPLDSIRAALPYGLILGTLLAGSLLAVLRWPAWGFSTAWFFIILAPTSSFVPVVGAPIAENRPYLALAGVIALVVINIQVLLGRSTTRLICFFLMAACVLGSIRRNTDYQSEISLLSDSVLKDPESSRARYNLGRLLAKLPDRQEDALAHYEAALCLDPRLFEAHNNLGLLLAGLQGRQADALAHYHAALQINPDYAEAHNNLANLFASLPDGQTDALAHYETALRLKPDYAEAHYNLANLLTCLPGRQTDALVHYETALRLKPDYTDAHYNLANLLAHLPGRQTDAQTHYEALLRLKPDDADAHNNFANLLAGQPGRQADAIAHYETALRLSPNNAFTHANLAHQLEQLPDRQSDAIFHYEKAVELDPNLIPARKALQRLRATDR